MPLSQILLKYLSRFSRVNRCFFCHDTCQKIICRDCEQNLPFLTQICERCATPLFTLSDPICGKCLKDKHHFYETIAVPFSYHFPINAFIIRLKFLKDLKYARLLGELFAEHLAKKYEIAAKPACIIPVPLHVTRLRERGFNQALEIAKPIAKALSIPIRLDLVKRVKNTLPQSNLSKKERKQNMRSAFTINKIEGLQHIAVIDDVITTGQTILALSASLKQAGIKTIDVWCVSKRILGFSENNR